MPARCLPLARPGTHPGAHTPTADAVSGANTLPLRRKHSPAATRPSPTAQPSPAAKPKPPKPDEWTEARRLFEQLSPDQQKKFLDNLDQWKTMPPEEQELFRDRELFRREKIAQEIQARINKSGLHLDDDQREVMRCATRRSAEDRGILRKETDQKRQSMVNEMLARLKVEFSATPTPGRRRRSRIKRRGRKGPVRKCLDLREGQRLVAGDQLEKTDRVAHRVNLALLLAINRAHRH